LRGGNNKEKEGAFFLGTAGVRIRKNRPDAKGGGKVLLTNVEIKTAYIPCYTGGKETQEHSNGMRRRVEKKGTCRVTELSQKNKNSFKSAGQERSEGAPRTYPKEG